jgi:transposase
VATGPEAIAAALERLGRPARGVLKTGRMANRLHPWLVARDLPAVCVDARQAHAMLSQMPNKTDANDAVVADGLLQGGAGEDRGGPRHAGLAGSA